MIRQLETERLILRPLELADAEHTQLLFPQWDVVKHLANVVPWPYPPDGAFTHYRDVLLAEVDAGKKWSWSLRLKTDPGQVIGVISLMANEDNNRGFWLGLPWHGQGLMTEAVIAATDFWFNDLGMSELRAPKAIANTSSRRISEKTGMRVIATLEKDYVSGRLPTELWAITADEWRHYRLKP